MWRRDFGQTYKALGSTALHHEREGVQQKGVLGGLCMFVVNVNRQPVG